MHATYKSIMATITLGGQETHTVGELPAVGSDAPGFTLTNSKMQDVTLGELKGQKVILNIFPSIDTGVCAMSTRKFNEAANGLENTSVLCVSRDLPFAHARFCGAEGLENVVSLSDYKGDAFGTTYGVNIADGAFNNLFSRAVVVIDENGKVTYTEQVPEIGQEPNYDAALAAVKG